MDGSGKAFRQDRWEREPGNPNAGFGITAVLEDGAILEKAAANVSVIRGTLTAQRAAAMSSRGREGIDPKGGQPYAAAALSLVFHSGHPLVPTLRGDVRLFQVEGQAWFGGGADLTPYYLDDAHIAGFHTHWRNVCGRYSPGLYASCKSTCDDYFYIPARKEHRGVGGLFYDDMSSEEVGFDVAAFTKDVGAGMLTSWLPYVEAKRGEPYTEAQREWQLIRRGRYLEFNLLYDRGVKFGLDGGRIESIMVSAPPLIRWRYDVQTEPGSEEERLVEVLRSPREWAV
ncbi:hypothetical protein FOA52_003177 [Chlamydomonas sp. UWO 241]|nr:hypothetical protein FOA52_003177 [Chlamydomonas sp. UWO 241]